MAITPISKFVVSGNTLSQLLKEESTNRSDNLTIPVNQEKTEYILTSVNLHRQWQRLGISQEGQWKEVGTPICDKVCDTICDGIVCDGIICDNNICDGIVCDSICDSVVCDSNTCDSICGSVCDKICDSICDKIS